ncbi:MAG TPA: hypothetical protein VN665_03320 [Candidatus Paceibacterota bacterium]|nr:hypothetical protein [Candidatus Paceibacterota bacterium]
MDQLPISITLVIALLTVFLCLTVGITYTQMSNFMRTRLIMTAFFFFIIATLTISFWQYRIESLPYTVPAAVIGMLLGYLLGVRTEQEKLAVQGIEQYMEHFSHVHIYDFTRLKWWSVINFYTVGGGLLLINLVGLSTVIFGGDAQSAIRTSMVGAFLLGTVAPYLIHLWSIRAPHHKSKTTSEV